MKLLCRNGMLFVEDRVPAKDDSVEIQDAVRGSGIFGAT